MYRISKLVSIPRRSRLAIKTANELRDAKKKERTGETAAADAPKTAAEKQGQAMEIASDTVERMFRELTAQDDSEDLEEDLDEDE